VDREQDRERQHSLWGAAQDDAYHDPPRTPHREYRAIP
jgi:hypothetical protein